MENLNHASAMLQYGALGLCGLMIFGAYIFGWKLLTTWKEWTIEMGKFAVLMERIEKHFDKE